jgi:hypothetical protein
VDVIANAEPMSQDSLRNTQKQCADRVTAGLERVGHGVMSL